MIKSGFGIEDDYQISIRAANISGVIRKTESSYIVTTSNNIYLVENQKITQTVAMSFSVITDIREYGLFAGFSPINGELFIVSKHDITQQLLSHFKTDQSAVSKLIHVPNSRLLLSIGHPTKAWRLDYFNSNISLSYVGSIKEEFDIFTYDPIKETIFYKKDQSIIKSFFKDKKSKQFIDDESILIFDYCPSSKQFALFKAGSLIITDQKSNQVGLIHTQNITFSIFKFINKNFIIGVDTFNDFYIC